MTQKQPKEELNKHFSDPQKIKEAAELAAKDQNDLLEKAKQPKDTEGFVDYIWRTFGSPAFDQDKEKDIKNQIHQALRSYAIKQVEAKVAELKNLWLDIRFLDKYSEDEDYWESKKGSNHTVEMHISDFERFRKALSPNKE